MRTKSLKKIAFSVILCFATLASFSQTNSSLNNLVLPVDSFWNGADGSGGFTSNNTYFRNVFTDWGGGFTSWSGYAYSNMNDTLTQGYSNQYSVYANNSQGNIFAVAYTYPTTMIKFSDSQNKRQIKGMKIANTSYAALSMKNGDQYAKKFGGVSGNDPDWFKLSIVGYNNGTKSDTIEYYLADFRFTNNSLDYIQDDWSWVDLTSLNVADSVEMWLNSSDTAFGFINTPTYYCIDDFTYDYVPVSDSNIYNFCLTTCGTYSKNLDSVYTDFDTNNSSFTYNIVSNSNFRFIHQIDNRTLNSTVLCPTKDIETFLTDTLIISVQGNNSAFEFEYIICADIADNINNEIDFKTFEIWPNPAVNTINYEKSERSIDEILIKDIFGNTVIYLSAHSRGSIDISMLNAGTYFITFLSENSRSYKKFIKVQ